MSTSNQSPMITSHTDCLCLQVHPVNRTPGPHSFCLFNIVPVICGNKLSPNLVALNNSHFNRPHDCVGQESGPSDCSALHAIDEVTRWYSLVYWQAWGVQDGVFFCLSPCWGWLEGQAHLEKLTRVPTHGLSSMVASR